MSVQDLIAKLQEMNATAGVIYDAGMGYIDIQDVHVLNDGRVELS